MCDDSRQRMASQLSLLLAEINRRVRIAVRDGRVRLETQVWERNIVDQWVYGPEGPSGIAATPLDGT